MECRSRAFVGVCVVERASSITRRTQAMSLQEGTKPAHGDAWVERMTLGQRWLWSLLRVLPICQNSESGYYKDTLGERLE